MDGWSRSYQKRGGVAGDTAGVGGAESPKALCTTRWMLDFSSRTYGSDMSGLYFI